MQRAESPSQRARRREQRARQQESTTVEEPACQGAGEQRASMPAALAEWIAHDTSVIQNAGEFRECGC